MEAKLSISLDSSSVSLSVLLKMQTLQQQGRQAQHGRTAGSKDTNTGSLTCTHNLVPHAFISVSYIPQVFWRHMPLHLPVLYKMQEKRLHIEAIGSGFGSWCDTTEFFSFHTMYLTQNPLSKGYKVTLISVWLLIPNSKDFLKQMGEAYCGCSLFYAIWNIASCPFRLASQSQTLLPVVCRICPFPILIRALSIIRHR